MTATIGELDLESAAKEAAGNWRDFDSVLLAPEKEIESPDDWAIMYTHHRDRVCSTRAMPKPSPKRWSRSATATIPM